MTRQNDNHSPGPERLVPSSRQGSEFSNSIFGALSIRESGNAFQSLMVRGKKNYTYKCQYSHWGPEMPKNADSFSVLPWRQGHLLVYWLYPSDQCLTMETRPSVGILALPFRPLYNTMNLLSLQHYESAVFPPFLEEFPLQMLRNSCQLYSRFRRCSFLLQT